MTQIHPLPCAGPPPGSAPHVFCLGYCICLTGLSSPALSPCKSILAPLRRARVVFQSDPTVLQICSHLGHPESCLLLASQRLSCLEKLRSLNSGPFFESRLTTIHPYLNILQALQIQHTIILFPKALPLYSALVNLGINWAIVILVIGFSHQISLSHTHTDTYTRTHTHKQNQLPTFIQTNTQRSLEHTALFLRCMTD